MATFEVFVYNLEYVKYGKLPTVACRNAFNFYATCALLTHPAHHMFVSTDIAPVCSSLSDFKFAYESPNFSTYVV